MAEIHLKNLFKRYGNGPDVVKGIDLSVREGELLVLVGPSGCGKSTTLRMIAGLERASSGDVYIGNRRVNEVEPGRRDIAMVFQNYALYPHMTVRKNMSFGLKMRKTPKPEIAERVKQAAQILSITELLDRHPSELSGGQKQRVAVGRAIVRQPSAFLFDEPLSNLDAKLRVQMRTELARLHQKLNTTTIYVTHDQVEAMTLGSRIVVMNDGEIQQVDTPLNIYQSPANRFVAGFIGSPPMNFIEGSVSSDGCFEAGDLRVSLTNGAADHRGPAVLGFRPEHLSESHGEDFANVILGVVERMGHETIVYFSLAGNSMVSRLPGDVEKNPGETLALRLPASALHLFEMDGKQKRIV